MPIVIMTAALCGIYFILLSLIAIKHRRRHRVGLGTNDSVTFQSAVRAQANFAEYTPISLILFTMLAQVGIANAWLVFLCTIFFLGRISHSLGLLIFEHREEKVFVPRQVGMLFTFLPLFTASILLLCRVF